MFSVPQPESTANPSECPIVILHHDSAADWELVLRQIYDGFREFRSYTAFSVRVLMASVSLADKYNIVHLRKEAASRLRRTFNGDFRNFPQAVKIRSQWVFLGKDTSLGDLINLAFRYGLRYCLPSMYLVALHDEVLFH
ncbi:hypothetical protein CC1G_03069 [Coprinopsis cinerea okayama7|uniref:Uncharacterized protein n=1 Tax=Coprinopsis cinerea (strain Okayama-7 / 130 / ATCC MYA-4618 / FGSC 9003) TaxID=240176 RepID=A8PET3_COPC7|nr:hypothetical protein CC1G_03069 [Coprinopsis cinerea okayama7\|eukprot:XP_001840840.2 hypothetical protein CC1G_03069 [Coprinopsis cinerea okayama7\